MFSKLSSFARSSVIALVAIGSIPTAASAGPFGPVSKPAVANDTAPKAIPVEMGNGRDCGPGYNCGFRMRSGRSWDRGWDGRRWDRRDWRRNDYTWNDRRAWRRDWRRHHRRDYWGGGSGFVLGLGLGVPLGYYGGGYYNEPVYRPRNRVYRGGGSAHVEWCYSRYRSYRAWDNTWKPYQGPRRQCFSPYS